MAAGPARATAPAVRARAHPRGSPTGATIVERDRRPSSKPKNCHRRTGCRADAAGGPALLKKLGYGDDRAGRWQDSADRTGPTPAELLRVAPPTADGAGRLRAQPPPPAALRGPSRSSGADRRRHCGPSLLRARRLGRGLAAVVLQGRRRPRDARSGPAGGSVAAAQLPQPLPIPRARQSSSRHGAARDGRTGQSDRGRARRGATAPARRRRGRFRRAKGAAFRRPGAARDQGPPRLERGDRQGRQGRRRLRDGPRGDGAVSEGAHGADRKASGLPARGGVGAQGWHDGHGRNPVGGFGNV